MNFLASIVILFFTTALFCWAFTTDWGLGPISHLVFFFGGIIGIGFMGIFSLYFFHS